MKRYLAGLDGIRGILALAVAFSHSLGHLTGWHSGIYLFDNVAFAVDIFFAMSGMVLIFAYKERYVRGELNARAFFITRFFRLVPLHVFMMFFVILALYISTGNGIPNWLGFDLYRDVISDLFLVNALGIFYKSSLNHPSWSISVELWVGSLLFFIYMKNNKLIYLVPIVVAFIILKYPFRVDGGSDYVHLGFSHGAIRGFYAIAIGMISYDIFSNINNSRVFGRFMEIYVYLVVVVCFSILWKLELSNSMYILIIPFVSVGLVFLTRLPSDNPLVELLECKIMKYLGRYSFTIYLTHIPVIYLMFYFKSTDMRINIAYSLLSILITIVISPYIYKCVEVKANNIGRRIAKGGNKALKPTPMAK